MDNTKQIITPVVLSGGSGTRLWPLSRSNQPKQFISLLSQKSLFEQTVDRCSSSSYFSSPVIITSQKHRFLIKKMLGTDTSKKTKIIMEPCGRNTAAAVCIAALAAQNIDDVLLIIPSDHYIPDHQAFEKAMAQGVSLSQKGHLVVFGIKPTSPHTGFGYIERSHPIDTGFNVKSFHEKPDEKTAESFLRDSNFFWNAGIFMGKASTILAELEKHAPYILEDARKAWEKSTDDLGDVLLNHDAFAAIQSEAFDTAVMEKTDASAVIPLDLEWNDLGCWEALWSISEKDKNNNVSMGAVFACDVKNSYLHSEGPVLGVLGLDDIVAVSMKDAVFIAPKNRSEDIKELVNDLKEAQQVEVDENLYSMRPWGGYEILEEQNGFKVKKLTIDSGARLSLQKHKHRSEHWVVVSGIATVTCNDDVFDVPVNESVYIPCGAVHRIENRAEQPLEIIEVQTGHYLGEDDIFRIEDDYNRLED